MNDLQATAAPTYRKEVVYDRESRDYAMYLDGELVGFARDYHSAEVTLDQLVYELLNSGLTRTATELDGGDPEAVELIDPVTEEGRHEQLAQDMGGVWEADNAALWPGQAMLLEGAPVDPSHHLAGIWTGECTDCKTIQACYFNTLIARFVCADRAACNAHLVAAQLPTRLDGGDPEQVAQTTLDDELRATFVCAACSTSEYEPDKHLPNFCTECIAAWQKGCYKNRLDPHYLQADVTEQLYAPTLTELPAPATAQQEAAHAWGDFLDNIEDPCIVCGERAQFTTQAGVLCAGCASNTPAAMGAPALIQSSIAMCTVCGGAHQPTQCPQIGAAMSMPFCDGQAGPCGRFGRNAVLAFLGSSDGTPLWETLHLCTAHLAQWEATQTTCPACGDPASTVGFLCPACREVGERPITIEAQYVAHGLTACRESGEYLEAIAGDIGGVVAYVNGHLAIVDVD